MKKQEIRLMCESPHEGHGYDLLNRMPDDERFVEEALVFQQLSDETRLKILYCLCAADYCVYDLAQLVGMSAPAISHHLRSLKQLKILVSKRKGKHVFYSMADSIEAQQIREILTNAFQERDEDGAQDLSNTGNGKS